MWLFANVLYGLMLNLAPLVLSAYLCGRVVGVGIGELYPGIGDGSTENVSAVLWVALGIGLLVGLAIAVVGARRFRDKRWPSRHEGESRSERAVVWLLMLAAVVAVLGLLLPAISFLLAQMSSTWLAAAMSLEQTSWQWQRVVLGLVGVAIAAVLGAGAVWLLRRRQLRVIRGVMAAASGAAVLLTPFLLAAETSAANGFAVSDDGIAWAGALVVVLVFAVFVHNRRYSMHLFYRERLHHAFLSHRVPGSPNNGDGSFETKAIPYSERILLSDIAALNASSHRPFPELIMCAAVAANNVEAPSKARAASFTFEGSVSGNAQLGLEAPTVDFEQDGWFGVGGLTLPSMMAISGAAVSPLMGRFTLPAFRFLMAVLNIRLGVWIRNPNHPVSPPPRNPIRRAASYAWRGWKEPGALYVLKEGLGLASARDPYIYVSDGGHWENLGLTELLRRRCTRIVVIDASGDGGLGDVGRAMAVSRAELGVEFDFDPTPTIPGEDRYADEPVAIGTFRYPDGQKGDIYYARCVLWQEAPSDLRLFANREQRFPSHPTANQFLSGEVFDAYRALGWAVGERLLAQMYFPLEVNDEPGPGSVV